MRRRPDTQVVLTGVGVAVGYKAYIQKVQVFCDLELYSRPTI